MAEISKTITILKYKNVMKKFTFILFALLLGMSSASAYDFSSVCPTGQTLYYNIIDAENHEVELTYPGDPYSIWHNFVEPSGSIEFPERVEYDNITYTVTSIGECAFNHCNQLIGDLVIPNSIKTIGDIAFSNCDGLNGNLILSNSLITIGYRAFYHCTGFTGELVIPNSVTLIGKGAFEECRGFTGNLIIGCSVSVIRDFAFFYCNGFTGDLIIPDSVIEIGEYAFRGCSGFVNRLVFSNSVSYIGDFAFSDCNGFTGDLIIPNSVTKIGSSVFKGCCGFTGDLVIPNSVTEIGEQSFEGCSGFNGSLVIPNSVIKIGSRSFEGCSGMTSIEIPNSVNSIGYMAFHNTGWYVSQPDGVLVVDRCCVGYKGMASGTLQIPEGTRLIAAGAFFECSGFTGDLVIPNSVTSIGSDAFRDCSGFTGGLTISNSVSKIENYTFANCSGFTGKLVIPDSVTEIGHKAFYKCAGFTGDLIIPDSTTTIGNRAFAGCNGFTGRLYIPHSVTSFGEMVFCGYGLTGIDVEPGNLVYDSRNACNAIIETATNTLLVGCQNTVIPNSVTSIGRYAFAYCYTLNSIVIPNPVISIDECAFAYCHGLTSIVIASSVANISLCAFECCFNLESIVVESYFPPTISYDTFELPLDIPVYVCPCTIELYRTDPVWRYFSNIQADSYYQLTVLPNFIEMGTTNIIQQPDCDHDAIVQATPNEGLPFSGWMEDDVIVSTDNPYQFTLTKDTHLVACFGYYGLNDNVTMETEIYPNPASEVVVVEGVDLKELEISNLFGQVLGHYQAAGEETRIDISTLPTGTYLLGITDACGKRSVRKMVKE